MFAVKQQALNKIQNKQSQLPKNTQESLQQMLAWDQEFLTSKDKLYKNKHQYSGNGGSALLQNNTNKKTNLLHQQPQQQQTPSAQINQISQQEMRQLQKKRKLQEIARENSKILKSQKQQQKENNEQIDSSQDASDEYEVEKIVDKKIENGQIFYKVKWKGWDSTYNTWEPENNLFRVSEMIEEYEASKKYQKRQNFQKQVDSCSSDMEDNNKQQNQDKNSLQKKGESLNQINQNTLLSKNESLQKLQQSQQKIQSNVIKTRQPSNNTSLNSKEQQDRPYKENQSVNKQNAKEMDSNNSQEKNQNMNNSQIQLEKNKQFFQLLINQKQQSSSSTSTQVQPQKQNLKNFEEAQNTQNNLRNQEKRTTNTNNIQQLDVEDDNIELEQEASYENNQKSQNTNKTFEENEDGNDEDKEYIFEAILDKRQLEGQEVEYLLKFSNHDKPEWELISNLESIEEEIREYEEGLKMAQQKAALIQQQDNLEQENLQFEEDQKDKEYISQTEPVTCITTTHSLAHQNKENGSQLNNQDKKSKIAPEQIDVDCSDDQFEHEVQKNQMDVQANLGSQSQNQNINSQPEYLKKEKKAISSELNSKQKQQQLNNQQVPPCQNKVLENVIQNQQPFNLVNPLLNNVSLQQLANISNPINYIQNYNFSQQEIGCFYKGDQRFSIEPCDQSTLQDLSKVTFKVMWKPRVNGCVPLPSLISYQMLKEHDPVGLVLFFENLIQKQQQQIVK